MAETLKAIGVIGFLVVFGTMFGVTLARHLRAQREMRARLTEVPPRDIKLPSVVGQDFRRRHALRVQEIASILALRHRHARQAETRALGECPENPNDEEYRRFSMAMRVERQTHDELDRFLWAARRYGFDPVAVPLEVVVITG